MTLPEARSRLEGLTSDWRRHQTIQLATRATAIALPLVAAALVATTGTPAGVTGALAAVALAGLAILVLPHPPRATPSLLARHLDRTQPTLEDSTTLLLAPHRDLSTLARLQQARVAAAFDHIGPQSILPRRAWRGPVGELLGGLLLALALLVIVDRFDEATVARAPSPFSPRTAVALDPLGGLSIQVEPPAYTGLDDRTQKVLDLAIEEGAVVTWTLPAKGDLAVNLVTGDGGVEPLLSSGDQLTVSTQPTNSTVYRMIAHTGDGETSRTPFARLEVVPDEPPALAVVSPAARLTELADGTEGLVVEVRVRDDYGLTGVELVTTLALGAGELVEFRERRIPLEMPDRGREATLRHHFDLQAMSVGPAAELYFHVEARDNRVPQPNVGRSPTTIVRIAGETETAADLGVGLPIILPPTYFRSQRQIIIDTEKLIAERDMLSQSEARSRSETLGADQRALRMRYGNLLGEEFVSGQAVEAGEAEADGDHEEHAADAGDEEKVDSVFDVLPEGLFHEHDSTEAATYFASETRALLKRVLGQMWEAEGRLRVVDPDGALPFEYQALELLKELQQASRIYVQKVGFEAPPLEPEARRLTGELDEIGTRHAERARPSTPEIETAARALLERLASSGRLDPSAAAAEARLLREPIVSLAAELPEVVTALEAIDDLLDGRSPAAAERTSLQAALWQLVPAPDSTPLLPVTAGDPLSRLYRDLRTEEGDS